jgi:hypothetical protein
MLSVGKLKDSEYAKQLLDKAVFLLVAGMTLLPATGLRAANLTWSGAGTLLNQNKWNATQNWTGGVVPTGTDNVIFNTGGSLAPQP